MSDATIVHLLRHGEVDNPTGVLYGRLPGFRLSERGRAMAEMVAEHLAGADGARRDLVHLVASPLQRAQETAAPVAALPYPCTRPRCCRAFLHGSDRVQKA